MKTNSIHVMALWAATLGAGTAIVGCSKDATPVVSAAEKKAAEDKAAADKAAADRMAADKAAATKAAADKAAADKLAADKAAAEKAAADKAAAQKFAADKAAAEKAAAEKAVADKIAADKAAAEKAAKDAKAETAALPTDLIEAKAEIARTLAQVDLTMAKLDALSTASGDLDAPSEAALAAMTSLETEFASLKARGDDMRDRGAAYFEKWEKQLAAMSSPDVIAIAQKRKDELSAKYAEVLTSMQESRAALDTYWDDMKTIHKAVDDGLTPDSQKLLVTQVKAAKEKADTLKKRVEATSAMLNQVSLLYTKP